MKDEPAADEEISEEGFDVKKLENVMHDEQNNDEIVNDKKTTAKKIKAQIKSSRKPKDSSVMLKKVETERGIVQNLHPILKPVLNTNDKKHTYFCRSLQV